jgi:hypothetical protein
MIPIIIGVLILAGVGVIFNIVSGEDTKVELTSSPGPTQTKSPTLSSSSPSPTTRPSSLPSPVILEVGNPTRFVYPGATLVETSNTYLKYQSFDDPQTITNWYKAKIEEQNLRTTSFVQTSSNGQISNKLIGSNGQVEIEIEIEKQPNNSTVSIILKN